MTGTHPSPRSGIGRLIALGIGACSSSRARARPHAGGINGFSACAARYPDDDLYVALHSNIEHEPAWILGRELAAAVLP